jgi:hypothetical protein
LLVALHRVSRVPPLLPDLQQRPAFPAFPPTTCSTRAFQASVILPFISSSFLRGGRRHPAKRSVRPGRGGEGIQEQVPKAGSPAPTELYFTRAIFCVHRRCFI